MKRLILPSDFLAKKNVKATADDVRMMARPRQRTMRRRSYRDAEPCPQCQRERVSRTCLMQRHEKERTLTLRICLFSSCCSNALSSSGVGDTTSVGQTLLQEQSWSKTRKHAPSSKESRGSSLASSGADPSRRAIVSREKKKRKRKCEWETA